MKLHKRRVGSPAADDLAASYKYYPPSRALKQTKTVAFGKVSNERTKPNANAVTKKYW